MIATTPTPPYYAVIFTSLRTDFEEGYSSMADRMLELAKTQVGYLGFESARNEIGISVSYWSNIESIAAWKKNSEHLIAQKLGKEKWYKQFTIRICKVEREYGITN
jgi:heme-degrading monooxygenase HmoA